LLAKNYNLRNVCWPNRSSYSRNVSFSDNYADELEKIVSDMHTYAKEDTEQIASEKHNVVDEGQTRTKWFRHAGCCE
jgi:hypothetical protein